MIEINYNGLNQEQTQLVANDPRFKRYLDGMSANFLIDTIVVTHVDWFGKRPGFIHVNTRATDMQGNRLAGCATIRGDAVGVLLVLHCSDGTDYTVLVEQARTPVAKKIFEIPAGTLDKGIGAKAIAVLEIQEEVDPNLVFTENELTLLYEGYASPGGSDESITLVSAEVNVTPEYILQLHGAITGVDETEHIRVHVIPLVELPALVTDLKSMLAYSLFTNKGK